MELLKQSIGAVFSDIDGTILNQDRVLSQLTSATIRSIRKNYGVPFVFISARMPKSITQLAAQLGLEDPVVAYNGGLVFVNNEERTVLQNLEIPIEVAYDISRMANELPIHVSLFRDNEWITPSEDVWAKREIRNTLVLPKYTSLLDSLDVWSKDNRGVHKIMCMGDSSHIDKVVSFMNETYPTQANTYRPKDTYAEITPSGTNKAQAMHKVLEYLGVDAAKTVAFGDNYNDIEMLQDAGHGVAMGNAPAKVKKAANVVGAHHKEDGVAHELMRIFNLQFV